MEGVTNDREIDALIRIESGITLEVYDVTLELEGDYSGYKHNLFRTVDEGSVMKLYNVNI